MQPEDDEPFELAPPPPQKPKKRRPWLMPLGLAAALLFVYFNSTQAPVINPPKSAEERQAEAQAKRWDQEWRDAVVKELMTGTIIKDASWGGQSSLRIGVIDDGTRRIGLAMYACEVVRKHRPNKQERPTISVWDIAKIVYFGEWERLETHQCR